MSYDSTRRIVQRNLCDNVVAEWLGAALSRKALKAIAHVARTGQRTVTEWRLGRRLPNAAALIRLIAEDDDIYLAVMEMAGREPAPVLNAAQKQALADAVKMLGIE